MSATAVRRGVVAPHVTEPVVRVQVPPFVSASDVAHIATSASTAAAAEVEAACVLAGWTLIQAVCHVGPHTLAHQWWGRVTALLEAELALSHLLVNAPAMIGGAPSPAAATNSDVVRNPYGGIALAWRWRMASACSVALLAVVQLATSNAGKHRADITRSPAVVTRLLTLLDTQLKLLLVQRGDGSCLDRGFGDAEFEAAYDSADSASLIVWGRCGGQRLDVATHKLVWQRAEGDVATRLVACVPDSVWPLVLTAATSHAQQGRDGDTRSRSHTTSSAAPTPPDSRATSNRRSSAIGGASAAAGVGSPSSPAGVDVAHSASHLHLQSFGVDGWHPLHGAAVACAVRHAEVVAVAGNTLDAFVLLWKALQPLSDGDHADRGCEMLVSYLPQLVSVCVSCLSSGHATANVRATQGQGASSAAVEGDGRATPLATALVRVPTVRCSSDLACAWSADAIVLRGMCDDIVDAAVDPATTRLLQSEGSGGLLPAVHADATAARCLWMPVCHPPGFPCPHHSSQPPLHGSHPVPADSAAASASPSLGVVLHGRGDADRCSGMAVNAAMGASHITQCGSCVAASCTAATAAVSPLVRAADAAAGLLALIVPSVGSQASLPSAGGDADPSTSSTNPATATRASVSVSVRVWAQPFGAVAVAVCVCCVCVFGGSHAVLEQAVVDCLAELLVAAGVPQARTKLGASMFHSGDEATNRSQARDVGPVFRMDQVLAPSFPRLPHDERVAVARNVSSALLLVLRNTNRAPTGTHWLSLVVDLCIGGVKAQDAVVRLASCQCLGEVCRVGGPDAAHTVTEHLLKKLRSHRKSAPRSSPTAADSSMASRGGRSRSLSAHAWAGCVLAVACIHRALTSSTQPTAVRDAVVDNLSAGDGLGLVFEAARVTNQPVSYMAPCAWFAALCVAHVRWFDAPRRSARGHCMHGGCCWSQACWSRRLCR